MKQVETGEKMIHETERQNEREGKKAIKAIKIVEQLRRIEAHKSRKRS